ncbi:MAG: DUF2610 domain-containing protein [Rickettsiales bacterium]|jgi:hypothetical protein|nr:DUF2610 domain-containing protein [Rickettsiales bacterium]
MTKEFSIPCDFNGSKVSVLFYIGSPSPDKHPIHFQSSWLSQVKGGSVPQDIMESIQKLYDLAQKHKVSFEELCFYAINVANGSIKNDNKKFSTIINDI